MTGVVVTGGTGPGPETLRKWAERADLVVAADTGLEPALDCGIEPAEVVGDMDSLRGRGLQGRTVSFFPVGEEPCRMQSRGLKWPLDGLVWRQGDVGISNVVTEALLEVKMISGRLIMVRALEESR